MAEGSIYTLPVIDYPDAKYTVTLSGTPFILRFIANSEEDCMSLQIAKENGDIVISGIKVVLGLNLIGGVDIPGIPTGSIFVVSKDMSARVSAFGYDDNTVMLYSDTRYDDLLDAMELLSE